MNLIVKHFEKYAKCVLCFPFSHVSFLRLTVEMKFIFIYLFFISDTKFHIKITDIQL